MTVNEIIKAQEICFIRQNRDECGYCKECPLFELSTGENCQKVLSRATIDRLNELTDLLDDKVNHHYYETLEFYQEETSKYISKIDKIREIIDAQ